MAPEATAQAHDDVAVAQLRRLHVDVAEHSNKEIGETWTPEQNVLRDVRLFFAYDAACRWAVLLMVTEALLHRHVLQGAGSEGLSSPQASPPGGRLQSARGILVGDHSQWVVFRRRWGAFWRHLMRIDLENEAERSSLQMAPPGLASDLQRATSHFASVRRKTRPRITHLHSMTSRS
ncbi:hypothetical protein FJT64_024650 [Amphibalanus amphitrite]|uniref:Uncharacterized protein n=1 Tax=Amphibalanus amphitrite TaxID=1232801 RepID=A0A6A4WHP4_AMPAM|nr:hypothetical protein FJT64_024650 [Amphibalanus amphitrite]